MIFVIIQRRKEIRMVRKKAVRANYLIFDLLAVLLIMFLLLPSCATQPKPTKDEILASIQPEADILGWEKAKWRMTHDQIVELYGIGRWDIDPEGRWFYKLKYPTMILNRPFAVNFFLDKKDPSGKLIKVMLVNNVNKPKDYHIYDDILEYLIKKYGKPHSIDEPTTEGSGDSKKNISWEKNVSWLKSSGKANLKIVKIISLFAAVIEFTPIGV
jgi:hypothetical protein